MKNYSRTPKRGFVAAYDTKGLPESHTLLGYIRKGYRLEPCPGAAHSNPHIDNCMLCAPLWGWIVVAADEASDQCKEHGCARWRCVEDHEVPK